MESNKVELFLWPLYKVDSRVVCTDPFLGKYHLGKNENHIRNNNDYCTIILEFPVFAKPIIYTLKSPQSYRDFLKLKNPHIDDINSMIEITSLYENSFEHLDKIIESLRDTDTYFMNVDKKRRERHEKNKDDDSDEEEEGDVLNNTTKKKINIWDVLNMSLEKVKKLLVKDPLYIMNADERKIILYCRDYICTIPSALELFLRCIDWFDPLQVNLARVYLKKWAKIDPEDAICLLDARFPDTHVREYAVSILKNITDDLLNLYMLQMCQALLYEPYQINPLADFLIEKSIKNPTFIGSIFFWNAYVCMKNRIFRERMTVMVATILMVSGNNFLDAIIRSENVIILLNIFKLDKFTNERNSIKS